MELSAEAYMYRIHLTMRYRRWEDLCALLVQECRGGSTLILRHTPFDLLPLSLKMSIVGHFSVEIPELPRI